MKSVRHTRGWFFAVLAGLALRALMPAGYMPASAGSGLLLELCPDQLPAGIAVAAAHAHHGHHGNHAAPDPAAADNVADSCDFAHLALVAAAATFAAPIDVQPAPDLDLTALPPAVVAVRPSYRPSPRGPPA